MYTNFAFVLLLIASLSVLAQSNEECQLEFINASEQAEACNPGNGYRIFDIESTFTKTAVGDLSKYQLRRYIQNTCRTALNDTQCVRNVRVSSLCQQLPQTQIFSNLIIILTTKVEYLCSVPPGKSDVRYLDWIKSDGPYCSTSNQAVDFCIKNGIERLGLTAYNNSLTANICTMLQIQNECSSLYQLCKNKKVFQYMTEISQILTELFNC